LVLRLVLQTGEGIGRKKRKKEKGREGDFD